MCRILRNFFLCAAAFGAGPLAHAAPDHVDITWMSIANMHFALGRAADPRGWLHHAPAAGCLLWWCHRPRIDASADAAGRRGGDRSVRSHWRKIRRSIYCSPATATSTIRSTPRPGRSFRAPASSARPPPACRCARRRFPRGVARQCSAGKSSRSSRRRHVRDPLESQRRSGEECASSMTRSSCAMLPMPDATGALRAGVAEDFPNGGGQSRLSVQGRRTAGAIQLVVPGLGQRRRSARSDHHRRQQLRRAARQSSRGHEGRGLESVDLWIATGGRDVAALVLPVLKPKAYLPVHWDGLFGAFKAGPPQPYADAALETLLEESGVRPIIPLQYMDRWRLDRQGHTGAGQPRGQAEAGFPLMRIAFLGLGNMGSGMAGRLLAAGHSLAVFNRTAARAAPFEKLGARIADSPRSAASQADIIIGMTADDESSRAMWLGQARRAGRRQSARRARHRMFDAIARLGARARRKGARARISLRRRACYRFAGCGCRGNPDTPGGSRRGRSRRGAADPHVTGHARTALRCRGSGDGLQAHDQSHGRCTDRFGCGRALSSPNARASI